MLLSSVPLFLELLAFRIVNALITTTYFQPDEFWQSLEPAHLAVFRYGYLTWEWRSALRSFAHPLIFTVIYQVSEWLDLGAAGVIYGPKVVQAVFAALSDYATYKLANRLYGDRIARITLFCTITSVFNFFVSVRTFSNSLESTICVCALNFWPLKESAGPNVMRRYFFALVLAAIACVLRPTNVLIWMYLGAVLIYKQPSARLIVIAVLVGTSILGFNAKIDAYFYGGPVFPLLNFLKFNVVESLSSFYGVNGKLYYLIEALPQLLILFTPFALHGLYLCRSTVLAQACVFVIVAYSLIAHKEVRFIFPLLSAFHIFTAVSIESLRIPYKPRAKTAALVLIAVIHIPFALYITMVHQRGVVDVTTYIRENPSVTSVGFLMPCHSTPWMSHMHRRDIDAWFLTCEPPRGNVELETYMDEADIFYADPVEFIRTNFPPVTQIRSKYKGAHPKYWPSHLVFFEALKEKVDEALGGSEDYLECARFFNSHFHEDYRRRGDVVVYCRP
ncbi:Alg9-like mannosyltransferase family-domain-containing protein [Myxozyma melibiosi]|uniref:Mannosyltransferase n=1 Tax=Myxozyma melibiosi TaxID=54550 RepID=A0ABR1FCP1_9ASCO